MKKNIHFILLLVSMNSLAQNFNSGVVAATSVALYVAPNAHKIVNGNPAFIYGGSDNTLKYIRANNALGTSSGTPVTVFKGDVEGAFNPEIVNALISVTDASNVAITNGGASSLSNNTNFGTACVTGSTVSKTYTIKNTGSGNLTLSGSPRAVLGGTDASHFSITLQPASTVLAGGSTTFTVVFDPSSAGEKNATITLISDDGTNSPFIINITGTGATNPDATISTIENSGNVANDGVICLGTPVAMSVPAGASSYLWSVGATSNTLTPTPGATATYSITVTNNGCAVTSQVVITVLPRAQITLGAVSPICAGENSFLLPYTVGSEIPTTYSIPGLVTETTLPASPITVNLNSPASVSLDRSFYAKTADGCRIAGNPGFISFSVTVNPINTVSRTSAVGTTTQSVCINTPISNITYATTRATGAIFDGLPAGVTGSWADDAIIISGTPSESGIFNYVVTLTGGCGVVTATGTLTVTAIPTLTAGTAVNSTTCTGNGSIPFTSTNLPDGTYSLSFTATGTGAITSPQNVTVLNNVLNLTGLTAGTYSNFSVTRNGCTATLVSSRSISSPAPPASPIVGTITQPNLSTATGSVQLSGLPSTGIWFLNPVAISGTGSSTTVTDLVPGTYNFIVTSNTTACSSAPTADVVINAPPSVFVVGNLVFNDVNRNGVFDAGDVGIDNVVVNIYRDVNNNDRLDEGDGTPVATTTTATVAMQAGTYLFEVVAGTYIVEVAASNFAVGGTLYNSGQAFVSSPTTSPPDPDFSNTDNDDNGNSVSGFGVATQAFNVAAAINHVDFGFKTPTRVSISDVSVNEGNNSSVTNFNFSVTRSDADEAFTLTVNTADGTAVSTSDYTVISNRTISFLAGGSLTSTVVGSVNRDNVVELDETFTVNLSGAPTGIYIVDAQATGTIVNDDISTISINNPTVAETNTGTTTMTFDIQMSNPSDADVSVNYATVDNTATITDNDYASTSGVITFAAGQTTKQVSVTINGDCKSETDEMFILRLSNLINNGRNIQFNGSGATLDATGTIQNNDIPLTVNAPTITQPTCVVASGTIIINATSTSAMEFSVDGGMNYQSSNTFSGLTSGSYNLAVRNPSNPACVISYASNPVVINPQPATPVASITGTANLSCSVSSVSRIASGGVSYLWSGPSSFTANTAEATITTAGTYTVTVTGSNGCSATATTAVTRDGSIPSINITGTTNLSCSVSSVSRTASGGVSYLWSGPSSFTANTAEATITTAGTYTVTVTGSNGCSATATTAVTRDGSIPSINITGTTNLSCSVSSVSRTASGGVSYLWSGPSSFTANTAEATITTAGTYTVTVTGSNGCSATATTAVTRDGSIPSINITGTTNLSCSVSSVSRTASGGVSYLWSGPSSFTANTAEATITTAGTYTVTVTGSNGCSATATTAVTRDGSIPSINITGTTNLSCSVSSVSRTASGGVSYLWSGPSSFTANTAEATITTAGTYTVTVTGSNGCSATATTAVTRDGSIPSINITGTTNLSCSVSSVSRIASGGVSYLWSGPSSFTANTAEATITTAGTYTVTVIGINGCSATATTAVTRDGSIPSINITGTTNLSCSVSSVSRTASGGVSYLWSGPSSFTANTAEATITTAGTYTVTVTGINGCSATATTAVTRDGSIPSINITGTTNLSCSVSSVSRIASGGASYLWSGPSSFTANTAEATITTAGTYTVTVTGSNGCSATATTAVTRDGSIPSINITGTANLSCSVSSVSRTASGGVSYLWSGPSSFTANTAEATITTAGTYTVTVTGSNGSATATTAVTRDGGIPSINITGTANLSCSVSSVSRIASGGVSYLWSGPSSFTANTAEATITTAGTYTVTVTGINGCSATATTVVTQDVSVPVVSITGTENLSCSVTSVNRTAVGVGSYLWSNGSTSQSVSLSSQGTYTVTVTGTNGCTATATTVVTQDVSVPVVSITGTENLSCSVTSVNRTAVGVGSYLWSNGSTSQSVSLSSQGTYTVTVTGTNGCTATATTVVTQDTSVPVVSITGTENLSCSVTSVNRTAVGVGSYLWSNGSTSQSVSLSSQGTYTVTVTGTNGCTATATTVVTQDTSVPVVSITGTENLSCSVTSVNRTAVGVGSYLWSNGSTSQSVSLSSQGTYTVTVTGTNGCSATATTVVTQDLSVPVVSITGTENLSCSVTSVNRTAVGVGSYLWSNGSTSQSVNLTSQGTYTVTVTGINGCSATATTVVTQDTSVPVVSITGTENLSCSVTSVNRTAVGVGSYLWSNGSTSQSVSLSSQGTYTVTVTGTNGCSATATTVVTQDLSVPVVSITGTENLSCSVTSVNRTAVGVGSYLWSNGSTSQSVSLSSQGTYTVTVTGTNGCTATATTVVTQDLSVPVVSITGTENLSCSVTSVNRTAVGVGSYLWSNGSTSQSVSLSSQGTYTVTVTGTNGCTATATTVVTQDLSVPVVSITGTDNLSCSVTSVNRTAVGVGSYLWSNGSTSQSVSLSSQGTYTVTVTGINGCSATATTVVTQDVSVPVVSITGTENLSCSVTSVNRTAVGVGSYLWSNGSTSQSVSLSSQGTYTVTVTGTNGCTATATTSVSFTNDLQATASNTGPYLVGQAISLSATGGSSYVWSGPNSFTSISQNPVITNALSSNNGIYTVTVTTGICTVTATTNVIVSGVDPCVQIVDLQYVKASNPYQPLFSLVNGSTIQQIPEQVSILAVPICPNITIESMDMTIVGPELNWTILQNVQPNALFDNLGFDVFGRNFIPGTYTLTITGYAQDNRGGGIVYGPVVTTFTIVGNLAMISAPTVTNTSLCAGSSVDVTFATTGAFDANNNFQVELSDVNGRFMNPIIIGITSVTGTITCQIPQSVIGGNNYRIRVASSNQVLAGNPSMSAISIIEATKNLVTDLSGTVNEKASQRIIASNKVIAPASVSYQAGKAIELNPGFAVTAGSTFKAEIRGCNN